MMSCMCSLLPSQINCRQSPVRVKQHKRTQVNNPLLRVFLNRSSFFHKIISNFGVRIKTQILMEINCLTILSTVLYYTTQIIDADRKESLSVKGIVHYCGGLVPPVPPVPGGLVPPVPPVPPVPGGLVPPVPGGLVPPVPGGLVPPVPGGFEPPVPPVPGGLVPPVPGGLVPPVPPVPGGLVPPVPGGLVPPVSPVPGGLVPPVPGGLVPPVPPVPGGLVPPVPPVPPVPGGPEPPVVFLSGGDVAQSSSIELSALDSPKQ